LRKTFIYLQSKTFLNADSVVDAIEIDRVDALYLTEFLNSLLLSRLPPHNLVLKVGVPIMLLRNMNGLKGQANGTRLIIRVMHNFVLDVEIISGKNIGARVFILRIPLVSSDTVLPFHLKRYQFPIRLAFGITINKAQGQTLDRIGVYLPKPVFAHGQLYVAASRVGSRKGVSFMLGQGTYLEKDEIYTQNVVYTEVL
jgi:ATP-dependent DNA helicase PIF1